MFYSRSLLSKTGPLRAIWLAAYYFKKLKKSQVFDTNIPSSVDEILQKQFDLMTYRVLAYLLLGVVRIYSRKVEYLFDDCQDVMIKINDFLVSEKSKKHRDALCAPYYSITLPDRFELDAFDLEILEDVTGDNVMLNEEITLKDGASIAGGIGHYSLAKYHCEEFSACHDVCSADYILTEDMFSSNSVENDMNVSPPPDLSHLEASMGKLQGISFSQEQRVDLDTSCGIEGKPTEAIEPVGEDKKINEESIKVPAIPESENGLQGEATTEKLWDNRFHGVEEEPPDPVKLYCEDHQSDGEQVKVPDLARLENETCRAISEDKNNNISNLQGSMDKLRDDRFHGVEEEPLDPIKLYYEDQQSDGLLIKVPNLAQLENETCQAISQCNNNDISNLQGSTEKLLDHIMPQQYMNAGMFCGSEEEPPKQVELLAEDQHTNAEEMKSMEISFSGNKKCQFMTRGDPLSVTLDATPQSKYPDASGATTPEFMAVRTPATKERSRILRKRKCCFDDVIVFPNHIIKQCIQDASDLVSKRRKTPRSAAAAWRASQMSNLSRGFLVPLLPCISSELRSLLCQEKLCIPETAKTVERPEPESHAVGRSWDKTAIAPETPTGRSLEKKAIALNTPTGRLSDKMVIAPETPIGRSSDQMAIASNTPTGRSSEKLAVAPDTPMGRSSRKVAVAPDTPTGRSSEKMVVAPDTPTGRSSEKMSVAPDTPTGRSSEQMAVSVETPTSHSAASRLSEIIENNKNACSIAGTPAHSYQTMKKDLSSSKDEKDEEFNFILMNEELNSCEADDQESDGWSSRTRMVARYLFKRFLYQKKRGEDEAVKLLPILDGKIKKESARFFYEILVLNTKGYVDVRQEDAYGDILIQKAHQWNQSCKAVCM